LIRPLLATFIFSLLFSCSQKIETEQADFTTSLIVGGELVGKKEFNGVVALVRGGDVICSGVAIDRRTVLTAAHCLVDQNIYSLSIMTGRGSKLPRHNSRIKGQYGVEHVELFPALNISNHHGITNYGEFNANDVGIIKIDRDFVNLQPYEVLTNVELIKEKMVEGELLTVVGYGYTGEDQTFGLTESHVEYGLKRKVEIPIVGFNNHEVDARADGKDSCYVDSGAPAFVKTEQGYKVLGIVSGSDGLCGENEFPAYYSLVFDSSCWISDSTGLNFLDQAFHCKRHETIVQKCSEFEDPKEAKVCASNLSQEIFEQF